MKYIKFVKLISVIFTLMLNAALFAQKKYEWKTVTANGYAYRYVTNDPMKTRFYTMKNGLTVILTENHRDPRIVYRMAVRAGSNNDPKDHTGLAHYLEHLLFKGTDKFGTLDWVKEKPYIDTIYRLYEQYNSTVDSIKRKAIYKEIDRVSVAASHYAISGEYSKLMTNIGSQKTNAHTAVEETVFEEDIPSNEVDKFLVVQAERFRNPVFRLFHTELEAVYEEKNRTLDNDSRQITEFKNAAIFPTHNYGQQTTIGTNEHLKNPSLFAIRNYYAKYYVPNNMGLVMAGDFNADSMIQKVDKYFSYLKYKPVELYNPEDEVPLTVPIEKTIFNNTITGLELVYRTPSADTKDAMILSLISQILYNSKAGLIDINLNKQQKLQSAAAGMIQYKDYGVFTLSANPKQGQTLEQLKELLLNQIDLLKEGSFDDELIPAIIANRKLNFYSAVEENNNRAVGLVGAFIKNRGEKWDTQIGELDEMNKVSKKDIVDIAYKYLGNGHLVLYKRKQQSKNIVSVEKPPITPVETNSDKQSEFLKKVAEMQIKPITPQWMDFNTDFQRNKIFNADLFYAQNKVDSLFRMHYRFEMGSRNNQLLSIAAEYLQYLGTEKYSNEQISKAFYNLACTFNLNVTPESCAVNLSGLQENFDKALILLEEVLGNCQPDEKILAGLKSKYIRSRLANKTNKTFILQGMTAYAKYGNNNPFNTVLSNDDIQQIKSEDLINIIHNLFIYKHDIIFYGSLSLNEFTKAIITKHSIPATFVEYPPQKNYTPITQKKNMVLFANYDMIQSEINWVMNEGSFDNSKEGIIRVFNNYFGSGSNSLVFQTIRDSKALAYATSAIYQIPAKEKDPFTFTAYVGCQSDKMNDAVMTMNELLSTLPVNEKAFQQAKLKRKTDIETERISGVDFIFAYLSAKAHGLDYDKRKVEYSAINNLSINDLIEFHKVNISGKPFTLCVVGSEGKVNQDDLKKIGDVKVLKLTEIFGY